MNDILKKMPAKIIKDDVNGLWIVREFANVDELTGLERFLTTVKLR